MPERQTGTFVGAADTGIFYQRWTPPNPEATAIVVHGYAEHSGRYAHVADALVRRGYDVWALDHRGHGRSEGVRAHVDRFQQYVDDFASFVELVRRARPAGPLFIVAHSMGALIATLYAFDHQDKLDGLALTGPAYNVENGAPPILLALSAVVSAIAPKLAVGPFDNTGISRDPAVVEASNNDPLVYHGKLRARLGREFLLASRSVLGRAPSLKLPVLVIQGEADRIINPDGARTVFPAFGSTDKTVKYYPQCFHEVLNEPEQDEIIALIGDWLDKRRGALAASAAT